VFAKLAAAGVVVIGAGEDQNGRNTQFSRRRELGDGHAVRAWIAGSGGRACAVAVRSGWPTMTQQRGDKS